MKSLILKLMSPMQGSFTVGQKQDVIKNTKSISNGESPFMGSLQFLMINFQKK